MGLVMCWGFGFVGGVVMLFFGFGLGFSFWGFVLEFKCVLIDIYRGVVNLFNFLIFIEKWCVCEFVFLFWSSVWFLYYF